MNTLKNIFLCIILFIGYLLINISLMKDLLFIIFIGILLILAYLYYIYKSKNYLNLIISIIIISIYSISFCYININGEYDLNLEDKNIFNNKNIERYSSNCINTPDCDLKEAFYKDIENINNELLNPSIGFYSIRNVDYIINGIISNLDTINEKGYLENITLDYNRESYLKNIIQSEYSSKINNDYFITQNNLLYSENQFKNYEKKYYNFIYNEIINGNTGNITNNKFENKNNFLILLNRKYFYNYLNNSQKDIIYYIENIDNLEEKISKIKSN